jgi:hypothetical protein
MLTPGSVDTRPIGEAPNAIGRIGSVKLLKRTFAGIP